MILSLLRKWLFGTEKKPRNLIDMGLGAEPSPDDERDFVMTGAGTSLPTSVRLKNYTIKSQGHWGSCSAHAVCSAQEILMDIKFPLSERHNWYHSRKDYAKTFPRNTGVYIRDAIKVAQKIGTAPEALCPYDSSHINDDPSTWAESFARFYKIGTYFRCWSIEAMKEALANGHPLIIGLRVWDGFHYANQYDIPAPTSRRFKGGHAVTAIGYDATGLILLNSWGTWWGRRGVCRVPWEVVEDREIFFEAWCITEIVRG